MSALAKKQTAPVASEGGVINGKNNRSTFSTPSAAELQERHLQGLEILADWKEDLERKRSRAELCLELIGVDWNEIAKLGEEVEQFKRCCRAFSWRPDEVKQ